MLSTSQQTQNLIWPAVLRAILSLRRDHNLSGDIDRQGLHFLSQDQCDPQPSTDCYSLLRALINDSPPDLTGRSLIGYLDFNRMGGLVVAMISSESIRQAISLLREYADYFFDYECCISVSQNGGKTSVSWQSDRSTLAASLFGYLLLAIFRHLAGRQFDFTRVALPAAEIPLITALSGAAFEQADTPTLWFNSDWLDSPSFHYNPILLNAVKKTLQVAPERSLQQKLTRLFESVEQPARLRIGRVAESLGMSEAALRRELKRDGLSFSQSLKRYIHEKASQALLNRERADEVAIQMGFSDRRSFDRSFKDVTGISPGQFRQISNRIRFQRANVSLDAVVSSLPPLPETIAAILELDDTTMQVADVVRLVEKDPVLQAHLIGRASRASFGRTPKSLTEAISRNIGLSNIKPLVVIFTAQQQLAQSRFGDIAKLTDAMVMADVIFHSAEALLTQGADSSDTGPLIIFGLLSLLILFHTESIYADSALHLWSQSKQFSEFRRQLESETGLCLYGASSLMLIKWGVSGDIVRSLWQLCEIEDANESTIGGLIIISHDIAMSEVMPASTRRSVLDYYEPLLGKERCLMIEKRLSEAS